MRDLREIDNLDNEFAEDRIRREQEVADAAIQAAERAARAQEQQLRDQQQYRFDIQDIGIRSERSIEDLIRGSDFVDTLSERINTYFGGFGLDQREQFVQDLAGRFDVETGFFGGGVSVGSQHFAPGEDLAVQSAEEIRRQLTPVIGFLGDIPIEELNNLILGIQSEQRDAIRGIEDQHRENQRDSIFESMNAEILNNSWKADIATIAANTANTESQIGTDIPTTDATQSLTEVVVESPILETPAIQEAMIQATQAMLTVENLEIAVLDAELSLLNESALAHMRAAEKHSAAADKYSTVADALLNVANQLASSGGRGAGGDYRFLLELPNGAIHEIGNTLIEDTANGSFTGLDGGG